MRIREVEVRELYGYVLTFGPRRSGRREQMFSQNPIAFLATPEFKVNDGNRTELKTNSFSG
jgi:hypothetical protein